MWTRAELEIVEDHVDCPVAEIQTALNGRHSRRAILTKLNPQRMGVLYRDGRKYAAIRADVEEWRQNNLALAYPNWWQEFCSQCRRSYHRLRLPHSMPLSTWKYTPMHKRRKYA